MTINDKTAAKIKEIRESKNINQAKFAKMLDLSSSAYSRLENGETQITLHILEKIADKLNVPFFELLDFKSAKINNYKNNTIGQSGDNSTLNISLTPEEFQKFYNKIKSEKK